jgi:glutamate decarboxylase
MFEIETYPQSSIVVEYIFFFFFFFFCSMPEKSMPARVAKQMIDDVLQINMNARMNMAGFLTTQMEPEGQEVITSALYVNTIDSVQYPSSKKMAERCVEMLADLWNAPEDYTGTETVGSTEGVYLGMLAMKKNWQKKRREAGLSTENPNIIFGSNAQIAWMKGCSYFDIEARTVKLHDMHLVMDPEKIAELIDENTIGVACMVGSTYTGQYEDVQAVNKVLEEVQSSRKIEIPIHVDAAAGGLIAPICQNHFIFDFRLPHVFSISFSGHKYGMVYPGIAFVLFRKKEWVPDDMKFTVDYLGKKETHMTMNFSRNGAFIAGQYYNFIRYGKEGYHRIFSNVFKVYNYLIEKLQDTGHFDILSTGDLPVVAFRLKPELQKDYDEFDIMHRLKEHKFMLPAYKMAPDAQHIKLLRACIRPGFDMELAEDLVKSLKGVIEWLDENGGGKTKNGDGEQQHAMC